MSARSMALALLLAPISLSTLPGCPSKPGDTGDEECAEKSTFYPDADRDGFGDEANPKRSCTAPDAMVSEGGDCDDGDPAIYPGAEETCDGVDNDCDTDIDEDVSLTWYKDADDDGFGDPSLTEEGCEKPRGYVPQGEDCDDTNAAVYPGADEVCDRVDNDCDGETDESGDGVKSWYRDDDGDGYGTDDDSYEGCNPSAGYVEDGGDCDDTNARVHPDAAEACDGIDNDCDGKLDGDDPDASGGGTWYRDSDGDGYGDAASTKSACDQPDGYVSNKDDCDDRDGDVNPLALEVCDGEDNDCDDDVDDEDASVSGAATWYRDSDGDNYGTTATTKVACDKPSGYVDDSTDCDDSKRSVNPGASETCDGTDQDCDGIIDNDATDTTTYYADADADGYGLSSDTVDACTLPRGYAETRGDCDDGDANVNPGATEVCNGYDDDCDGSTDEGSASDATWYKDADGDGFGDAASTKKSCTEPAGYVSDDTDCDDTDDTIYPGADEYCDDVDNNCNDTIDDSPVDGIAFAADEDEDGFGAPGTTVMACTGVSNELDCDDTDASEPQVVDAGAATAGANGTSAHPWTTIQEGIDAASMCVVVGAGTYYENLDFDGKGISVFGIKGADYTIIDGSRAAPVVKFDSGEGVDAELAGFTLVNGMGFINTSTTSYSCGSSSTCTDTYTIACGGGIYIGGATPTLHDLVVTNNDLTMPADTTGATDNYYYMSYGGGVCFRDTTMAVHKVNLLSNYADDGGGAYVESSSAITYSEANVAGNTADTGAGFEVDGGNLTLTNVAFWSNEATTEGGGVRAIDATLWEINVTHAGDAAPTGGAVYSTGSGSSTYLMNTIVYGSPDGIGVLLGTDVSFSGSYNDVYGNTDGNYSGVSDPTGASGNISSNPRLTAFTDDASLTNDDLRLQSTSPCVDTGNPSSSYNDSDGSRNDMGAFGGADSGWSPAVPAATDDDGDGYDTPYDCDDGDATVHPGVDEDCDDVDNDCDGIVDESCGSTEVEGLMISEIMYNPSGDEPDTEWFEVYNYGTTTLDLTDTMIYSSGSGGDSFYVASLTLTSGSYAVFCYDDASLGRDCDYVYGSDVNPRSSKGATYNSGFTFTNTGITLQVVGDSMAFSDEVTYEDGSPWPTSKNGYAIQVDRSLMSPDLRTDGSAWCHASTAAGSDYGTPGDPNSACP